MGDCFKVWVPRPPNPGCINNFEPSHPQEKDH